MPSKKLQPQDGQVPPKSYFLHRRAPPLVSSHHLLTSKLVRLVKREAWKSYIVAHSSRVDVDDFVRGVAPLPRLAALVALQEPDALVQPHVVLLQLLSPSCCPAHVLPARPHLLL